MTNREWYMNKLSNMTDEEFADAIFVPEEMYDACDNNPCFWKDCNDCKSEWLKSEHKEELQR